MTIDESLDIPRQARALAAIYRSLATEMLGAADQLDIATAAHSLLPAISIERMAEAIRAGIILHYLADRAVNQDAPIGAG